MKKACVGCGKLIPSVALDCVFCSAKQPADVPVLAPSKAGDSGEIGIPMAELAARVEAERRGEPKPLVGMPTAELNAVVANLAETPGQNGTAAAGGHEERPVEAPAASTSASPSSSAEPADGGEEPTTPKNGTPIPSQARLTATMQVVTLPPDAQALVDLGAQSAREAESGAGRTVEISVDDEPAQAPVEHHPPVLAEAEPHPFEGLGRTVMGVGGVVLIALFFLPWHGVSSWQLLETLSGPDFVRQLFYLTGGIVLLASAILPLPFAFRASVGAVVAGVPVLVGAGGLLDGWRGQVAALAVLGLPATHLLRARAKSSAAARALVLGAIAAVAVLYLVPAAQVVPIVGVFKLIGSGEISSVVFGIVILIPLVFAGLSLLGLLGRDLTDVGVLIAVLSLLWAPFVVALRGLLIDDGTQLYVALSLLWASATSALSLAQLLSLAARRDAAF